MVDGCSFAKTICSICYEDLKPLVEDLQAIPVCGHVFHELCLQQWFEYCSSSSKKKYNCPVCKQTCSQHGVGRLYFQSIGGPNDPILSQKPADHEENPEALRREVKILEVKVSGLNSALEHHQKNLKDINEELCICKERAKKEETLKNEALSQKTFIQQLLHTKSEELVRSTSECLRLQERNMALAKELAAFKLMSDLNLEEDEVLKLASLGNQANTKDTVDILRKSLVIRNKSYKELMEKCNLLGRGEARTLKKLEKAKEKMSKLKGRLQELETAIEVKDNEVLRALKASKKSNRKVDVLNSVHCNSSVPSVNNNLSENHIEEFGASMLNIDKSGSFANKPFSPKKKDTYEDVCVHNTKEDTGSLNQEEVSYFLIEDDEEPEIPKEIHSDFKSQTCKNVAVEKSSRPEVASDNRKAPVHGPSTTGGLGFSGSKISSKNNMGITHAAVSDKDEAWHLDDVAQVQPSFQIRKDNSSPVPLAQPGDRCFSGGLLGPDGTSRYLGKWCKRIQDKGRGTGDLISVGADGRGGRIKVLRSINQSSDGKETSSSTKRCKLGAKTNSAQGCLQIEHFFGRVGH